MYKLIILDYADELGLLLSESDQLRINCVDSYDELIKSIKKEEYDTAIINPEIEKDKTEIIVKALLTRKIPVLVILERYDDVEKIIESLSAGAFDYFQRPVFKIMAEEKKNEVIKEILSKISLASQSKDKIRYTDIVKQDLDVNYDFKRSSEKIIVIASSTGGPQSLEQVIPHFPKEIPAPILVVQHMPPVFTAKLAERLNAVSNVKVKEAEDGEEIKDGTCYIAKGDYHMSLKKNIQKKIVISLNQKEKILGVRPCANITMESASKLYGKNVIGVVLTGMGSDGTVGCKKIKEKDGTIIVQSEATSIIFGMPKSAIQSGHYDAIVDLQKIPVAVLQVLEV